MIVDAALGSALASALVPIVVCVAAGSALGRGDCRWPGADMLVGFGLLGGALAILAITTPIPLSWLMAALAVKSIVALAIRRQIPGGSATWIALALVSPILVRAEFNKARDIPDAGGQIRIVPCRRCWPKQAIRSIKTGHWIVFG